jgi:hypothetical protein
VTYTDGQIYFTNGGNIFDVVGKRAGSLNVFVSAGYIPTELIRASGRGSGAVEIVWVGSTRYAFTFIGLRVADAFTLEHEFAHHFIGNTLGQTNWFKSFFIEEYINQIVLPHVERYGDVMRNYSQQILNP